MKFFLSVFHIIPKDWRRKFFLLMGVFTLLGFLEMIGIASIMPFFAVLSDPGILEKSSVVIFFRSISGVNLSVLPLHLIGLVVLILFIVTNLMFLFSTWLSIRFSNRLAVRLASDVAGKYFSRGYGSIRCTSPSVLANYTVREVEKIVSGGVLQLCLLVSRSIQVLLILSLLLAASPFFSLMFSLILLVFYVLLFIMLKTNLTVAGQTMIHASGKAANAADELYTAAKEILVRGNLEYFLSDVRNWLYKRGDADEVARIYPLIPKYVVELTAFTAILSVPIYKSWVGDDFRSVVPFMALFAYAGYRLLPALQQVFASVSTIRFVKPTIEYFDSFLREEFVVGGDQIAEISSFSEIIVDNLSFKYLGSEREAVSNIAFNIRFGEKVAIIGASGSGKSTVLDLLLGLIIPLEGRLIVDGVDYREGFHWIEDAIGYAPQAPLMLNKTIAENIAFGISESLIDRSRCVEVAKIACIDGVIRALPNGYETCLGSNGIELSGGERQRISVARSLYHSPKIAIFDEPSSALDPIISRQIVQNLCKDLFDMSVIVVTHDWGVLEEFDKIIILDEGKLVYAGEFAEAAEYLLVIKQKNTEF